VAMLSSKAVLRIYKKTVNSSSFPRLLSTIQYYDM
jgi:hypothetical protein